MTNCPRSGPSGTALRSPRQPPQSLSISRSGRERTPLARACFVPSERSAWTAARSVLDNVRSGISPTPKGKGSRRARSTWRPSGEKPDSCQRQSCGPALAWLHAAGHAPRLVRRKTCHPSRLGARARRDTRDEKPSGPGDGRMIVAVVLIAGLAYWDAERESVAALQDFAQEQATLASALGAGLRIRAIPDALLRQDDVLAEIHSIERAKSLAILVRPPGSAVLRATDGSEVSLAPAHGRRPRRSVRGPHSAGRGGLVRTTRADGPRRPLARRRRRRTFLGHPGGRHGRARARSRAMGASDASS